MSIVKKITKSVMLAPLRVLQGAWEAAGEYVGEPPKKEPKK